MNFTQSDIKRVMFLVVLLAVSFLLLPSCSAEKETSRMAEGVPEVRYYFTQTYDEGLRDATGHGHNGVILFEAVQGAWMEVDGISIVKFSGEQDRIEVPFKAFPGGKGRMVMSVNLDKLSGEPALWSAYTTNGDIIKLACKNGKLRLSYYHRNSNKWYHATAPDESFTAGRWYDITASWDASDSLQLALDGKIVAQTLLSLTANFTEGTKLMTIGNERSGGHTMQGIIRLFELWNQPISQQAAVVQTEKKFEAKDVVTLDNSHLSISFAKDALVPVGAMAVNGKVPLLCDSLLPDEMLLWQVEFMTELGKGERFILNNQATAVKRRIEKEKTATGELVKLCWDGLSLPGAKGVVDVVVTVDLPDDSQFSYWKIEINSKDKDKEWALWNIDFPIVNFANPVKDKTEDSYLALPYRWGIVVPDPFQAKAKDKKEWTRNIGYPSNMHMQFYAVYGEAAGAYVGIYDSKGWVKELSMTNVPLRGRIRHKLRHYPYGRGSGAYQFKLAYPIVFGTFKGDWYDASQIYRKWALQQPWCSKGPVVNRDDIPDWLKDTAVILKNCQRADRKLIYGINGYNRMMDEFGPNVMSLWWNWWKENQSVSAISVERYVFEPGQYGQTREGREGLPEAVAQIRKRGGKPFSYIQSKVYDQVGYPLNEDAKMMRPAAIQDIDGKEIFYLDEILPCWLMCRATKQWQDRFIRQCEFAIRDCHFAGIHMDSFGRNSRMCYNPSHNHGMGTGTYRCAGQHKMAERTRKAIRKIDPQACLSAEAPIEFFIDVVDAKLMHYNVLQHGCPLWSAVYHDYQIFLGRMVRSSHDNKDVKGGDDIFRMGAGSIFIRGGQIGRFFQVNAVPYPFAPRHKHLLEFATQLIKLKQQNKDFLNLGIYKRPVKITPKPEIITAGEKGKKQLQLPEIITSSWQSYDGRAAIVLVNLTEEVKDIEIEFDAVEYGFEAGTKLTVTRQTSAGTSSAGTIIAGKVKMKETLGPTRAVVLELNVSK
ncbi:MAG: LamG domain-containing protein [Anaerohalosphaeraceae bacterium]|nr:LamG domain-containing protein [Anaerohalosphaeraceae bacterium]